MKNRTKRLLVLMGCVMCRLYAAELPEKQVPSAPAFEEFQAAMQEGPEMQGSPEYEEDFTVQAKSAMQPQPSAPPENIFVHEKPASLTESEDRVLIDEGLSEMLGYVEHFLKINEAYSKNEAFLEIRKGLKNLKMDRESGQLDTEKYREQLLSLLEKFKQFIKEVQASSIVPVASTPPTSVFESGGSSSESDASQAASSSTSSWSNLWGWWK